MKKIILSALMLTGMLTFAQEGKLTVSGTVDAYFQTGTKDQMAAPTSFANDQGFAIGMVNTIFSYEKGNAGVVADLVYGQRGEDAAFGAPSANSTRILNQAYAYYNATDALTFTLGRFNTFYGYEVISPAANANYTTSYLFSSGPFSHTGLKIDYAVSEDFSIMAAIMNPTDAFTNNGDVDNNDFVYGLQLGFKGQYLNFEYGDQDGDASNLTQGETFRADYTGGFDLSDTFSLGINAAYNTTNVYGTDNNTGFYGAALYLGYTLNDTSSLTLRPELFTEYAGKAEADVVAVTLTYGKSLTENLSLLAEARYDNSNDDFGFVASTFSEKKYANFLVAAVYSF